MTIDCVGQTSIHTLILKYISRVSRESASIVVLASHSVLVRVPDPRIPDKCPNGSAGLLDILLLYYYYTTTATTTFTTATTTTTK